AVAVNVVRALESADPAHGSCSVGSKQGAGVPGQARWDWAVATATSRRCAWPGEDVVMRAGKLARPAARPDSGPALQRSRQSLAHALASVATPSPRLVVRVPQRAGSGSGFGSGTGAVASPRPVTPGMGFASGK